MTGLRLFVAGKLSVFGIGGNFDAVKDSGYSKN